MIKIYATLAILSVLFIVACQAFVPKPVDQRDKFTGSFNASENSYSLQTTNTFKIIISKSAEPDSLIYIKNFYNAGLEVTANVSGNKISIPLQVASNYKIEGIGSINGTQLTLTYNVRYINAPNYFDECLTKCTKN